MQKQEDQKKTCQNVKGNFKVEVFLMVRLLSLPPWVKLVIDLMDHIKGTAIGSWILATPEFRALVKKRLAVFSPWNWPWVGQTAHWPRMTVTGRRMVQIEWQVTCHSGPWTDLPETTPCECCELWAGVEQPRPQILVTPSDSGGIEVVWAFHEQMFGLANVLLPPTQANPLVT